MNLHQTFSLLGHRSVRRHQTLVLRTYSTPRRGLDAKLNMSTWLNLTSTSLLARALITNAGCMTERPKLSHNRESRRGSPTMPMIQLPLLTIDLTADWGELTSFLFSLQTGELTNHFIIFLFEKVFRDRMPFIPTYP